MSSTGDPGISSSTPIKNGENPVSMNNINSSVTDLLQAIDKNISSTSLEAYEDDSTNNFSSSFNVSDDNPIKPLNLKPLSATPTSENLLDSDAAQSLMENIPRAPSFDELEFNTRLNRESSISRLSGPRQLANSSLSRTFSNSVGRSSSFKMSNPTTRDNSPSKKSVCFEASPPKILEYDEPSPDNSDNSLENQSEEPLQSTWNGKLKSSDHPLPPPPPKHQVFCPPSPQKDTTLGSSDEDSQDFNLTKEDLQNYSITLEQRLDLVLGSDDVSKRVQEDEINRGSGSPLRSMSKKEEDLILSIKNKQQLAEEEALKDASELFEQDLHNSDKTSNVLRLDPVLKRKNSNNSLREEERHLETEVVASTKAPIVLEDGMKNIDVDKLPPNDDLFSVAESTVDSFASATDIFESEPIEYPIKKEPGSSNSISTLEDESVSPTKQKANSHKKKLSLSESINSFISSFGSKSNSPAKREGKTLQTPSPDSVPDALISTPLAEPVPHIMDVSDVMDLETPSPRALLPSAEIQSSSTSDVGIDVIDTQSVDCPPATNTETADEPGATEIQTEDNSDSVSIQSSIDVDISHHTKDSSPVEHQSLLEHSSPVQEPETSDLQIDDLLLVGPPLIHDAEVDPESSFADEFKETMLYNSSDRMNEDYRSMPVSALDPTENVLDALINEDVISNKAVVKQEDVSQFIDHSPETHTLGVPASPPMLKSPLDGPSLSKSAVPADASAQGFNGQSKSTSVQTDPVEVEVAVQTDDLDFGEDFGGLDPSLDFDSNTEHVRPVGALPSFNSTLFHDKVPEEKTVNTTPPTNYIDIWNSLPKQHSPQPQYGFGMFGTRKVTPPENILRRLSTRRSKNDRREKITLDATQIKQENQGERRRLSLLKDDSFVATSVSQSSFVKVESRDASFSFDQASRRPNSYVDSSNILADSSAIGLPDISNSSDFATAFKDWDVSQNKEADRSIKLEQLKKAQNTPEDLKAIWGSDEPTPVQADGKSRTPSVDAGKIHNMLSTGENGEMAHVKSSSAVGEVVVTNQEDHGVEIEYDSQHNISDIKPFDMSMDVPTPVAVEGPSSVQTPAPKPEPVYSMTVKSVHPLPSSTAPSGTVPSSATHPTSLEDVRLVSGLSDGNGFDFSGEFERAMKIRVPSTGSQNILDDKELSEPVVPEVDNLNYMKTRVKRDVQSAPAPKPQGPRVRTPLGALAGSDLNNLNRMVSPQSRKVSVDNQRVISQKSENYHVGDLTLHKRDSRMSMFQDDKLAITDKGRLYIHINRLDEVCLDHIKNHKASFKLYLDNGKHTISTPKINLENNVTVDKEFEVAIDEDVTDLHFAFKITYIRPENELVEVAERIPLKNNRFSRIMGVKPKYRIQKSFITRKVVDDPWDHKFANDGSFGKNKINFFAQDNDITGKTQNYVIELFNEWETVMQNGKEYKKPPYMIAKMDVTMLYIPRSSHLETLPPSINVANTVSDHLVEQSSIRYEGFLFQEGGDCELWKRRYFRIEGTKMIAHHEVTKKPRAQINLLKVVEIIHNGKKKARGQRNFTDEILMNDGFKLKFKNGEIITFNAETVELKADWIAVLEKIVGFNKLHQPWVRLLAQNKQK